MTNLVLLHHAILREHQLKIPAGPLESIVLVEGDHMLNYAAMRRRFSNNSVHIEFTNVGAVELPSHVIISPCLVPVNSRAAQIVASAAAKGRVPAASIDDTLKNYKLYQTLQADCACGLKRARNHGYKPYPIAYDVINVPRPAPQPVWG